MATLYSFSVKGFVMDHDFIFSFSQWWCNILQLTKDLFSSMMVLYTVSCLPQVLCCLSSYAATSSLSAKVILMATFTMCLIKHSKYIILCTALSLYFPQSKFIKNIDSIVFFMLRNINRSKFNSHMKMIKVSFSTNYTENYIKKCNTFENCNT